jgi:hypothetical protein
MDLITLLILAEAVVAQTPAPVSDNGLMYLLMTSLTVAFGWLTKQIADLKKEVQAANVKHELCEKALFDRDLKIQRLELCATTTGQRSGTGAEVSRIIAGEKDSELPPPQEPSVVPPK